MDVSKGQIVRSLMGRDKGRLYCVAATEGDFLLLCDGKRRRFGAPKRKRSKHVELTGMSTAAAGDGELRRALASSAAMKSQGGNHAWQKTI